MYTIYLLKSFFFSGQIVVIAIIASFLLRVCKYVLKDICKICFFCLSHCTNL